jgi:hypothetical protein
MGKKECSLSLFSVVITEYIGLSNLTMIFYLTHSYKSWKVQDQAAISNESFILAYSVAQIRKNFRYVEKMKNMKDGLTS